MRMRPLLALAFAVAATSVRANPSLTPADPATRARLSGVFQSLPLAFEPNRGQFGARVGFLARGRGYDLSLSSTEAVLALAGGADRHSPPGP